MKARSDRKPLPVVVEKTSSSIFCDLVLTGNIVEVNVSSENDTVRKEYEYDLYRMQTVYREDLLAVVQSEFDKWFLSAKKMELAKSVGAPTEQDKLNAELLLRIARLEAK